MTHDQGAWDDFAGRGTYRPVHEALYQSAIKLERIARVFIWWAWFTLAGAAGYALYFADRSQGEWAWITLGVGLAHFHWIYIAGRFCATYAVARQLQVERVEKG